MELVLREIPGARGPLGEGDGAGAAPFYVLVETSGSRADHDREKAPARPGPNRPEPARTGHNRPEPAIIGLNRPEPARIVTALSRPALATRRPIARRPGRPWHGLSGHGMVRAIAQCRRRQRARRREDATMRRAMPGRRVIAGPVSDSDSAVSARYPTRIR